jgi:UDP-N-acetylmuramate dehydrogenase
MKLLLTHELTGLEFSAGVPASVGGMIAMNFGCWGQEICDDVLRIKIVTPEGESRWISKDEAQFGYRSSIFQQEPWIITQVQFQLKKAKPEDIKTKQLDNIALRLEKQPLREKTFGSTFKNPEGHFAGQLIEDAGYKGVPKGAVMFSPRHANFLVNQGGGTFAAAVELISEVQNSVWEKNKIKLETEVKIIP